MAPAMLWRLLWAIIVVVVVWALIPPVTRVLGFTMDADLMTILRIVIGALAVMYIIWGPHWTKNPPA